MYINFNKFLLEKSSLSILGVPDEVMKEIQINFEINSNANWEEIILKKDIISELRKKEKAFYISILHNDNIQIFINNNTEYFTQYFKLESGGWSSFRIDDRVEISLTQIRYSIPKHTKFYKLLKSDFKLKPKSQRLVQAQTVKLEKTTEEFKNYILKHFNNIVKRMYGTKYYRVMVKISENLSKVTQSTTATELLRILTDNKKLAKIAAEYEDAKSEDDILKLQNLEKKYNSLSTIDEYLMMFENEYSEEFNYFVNIKDLINDFGRMQIETSFMYFLYTGKIKKLKI